MRGDYKKLIVWQKSVQLVINIYEITEKFPKEEIYGLTNQIRRAAVAIPSNIAEGYRRNSKKEYRQFLAIAYSSAAELETQFIIAKKLPKTKNLDYNKIDNLLEEILKMLNKITYQLGENNG